MKNITEIRITFLDGKFTVTHQSKGVRSYRNGLWVQDHRTAPIQVNQIYAHTYRKGQFDAIMCTTKGCTKLAIDFIKFHAIDVVNNQKSFLQTHKIELT